MLDYSLNWTARYSAIQEWQRSQWCSSPTQRWPIRSQGLLASSVPRSIDLPALMPNSPLKNLCTKQKSFRTDVLKKHDVFYSSEILEVTWYEPLYNTSKFLIIKGFQTIVFIFIVISITFQPICPPAFFRCLSNSATFAELRTTSLWIVQQDTWRNGYRRWFPKLLRRQSSGGCRFNPDCRWVTIQEYLTLVPSYG